jgi:molybdate transport system ATP-binding protein
VEVTSDLHAQVSPAMIRPSSNPALQKMLTVQLQKRFPVGDFAIDLAFTLGPGITILFGPSGAGKTTLLDCIAGLSTPDAGKITVGSRIFFDRERSINLPAQHRKVGYVFQDLALFPHLTAEQNIQYGLAGLAASERRQRSNAILDSFRISHQRQRKPKEISGGEKQRVALARALVIDPCVLLLDEPLTALDAATKSKIIDDLRAWNAAHSIPILYVTHNREEVFALGDRVLVLENGRIIADGTPHAVMAAPRQESLAQLIGFENILHATMIAANEDRGTMSCQIHNSNLELETPLLRTETGSTILVGIRAGDILLATVQPTGLSARNIILGRIVSLEQRDVIVVAKVDCGVYLEVHLTLAARDVLHLQPGLEVWLIVKTHSCHLMTAT